MVNVPEPPVNVQFPEIVFPLTVPIIASVFPIGVPDWIVRSNLPFTCPLKVPLRVKEPVSVSPELKQGEMEVNLKFETLMVPLLFCWSVVLKPKAGNCLEAELRFGVARRPGATGLQLAVEEFSDTG